MVRSTAVRGLMGGMAQQAKPVSPLLDSVVAHCFRVSLPCENDRRSRRSALSSQLGRISSWSQVLLDRGTEIVGWPANVRSLDELAVYWIFNALSSSSLDVAAGLATLRAARGCETRHLSTPVDWWLSALIWFRNGFDS